MTRSLGCHERGSAACHEKAHRRKKHRWFMSLRVGGPKRVERGIKAESASRTRLVCEESAREAALAYHRLFNNHTQRQLVTCRNTSDAGQ